MSRLIPENVGKSSGVRYEIVLCQHGRGLFDVPQQQNCIKVLYVLRGQLQIDVNGNSCIVGTGDLFVRSHLHQKMMLHFGRSRMTRSCYTRPVSLPRIISFYFHLQFPAVLDSVCLHEILW